MCIDVRGTPSNSKVICTMVQIYCSVSQAMVRGVAKAQSQAKAQKKADAMKSHGSQLEDQKKGLKLICPACKVSKQGLEQLCGGGSRALL